MSNDGRFHPNHFFVLVSVCFLGHCLSQWESFGIDVLPRFLNFPIVQVASNESMKQFLGIRNVRLDAFAHTHPARHSPTEMASWKFLDELLEFNWFILVLVWQHSFENLRKPKHVQKCCFANFIEQIQAINKTHKNPSYFFNQRRCEKEHGIPLVFSEKMIPLMTTFLPRSG